MKIRACSCGSTMSALTAREEDRVLVLWECRHCLTQLMEAIAIPGVPAAEAKRPFDFQGFVKLEEKIIGPHGGTITRTLW